MRAIFSDTEYGAQGNDNVFYLLPDNGDYFWI